MCPVHRTRSRGDNVVVDRCNFDAKQRDHFVSLSRAPITCAIDGEPYAPIRA
jgi:hypothetical protein